VDVDTVEWVELPNILVMSQYADGGYLASKPYVASGKYINRMSNYRKDCRYNPAHAAGDDACPNTTLYWDFLARHRQRVAYAPAYGTFIPMREKSWCESEKRRYLSKTVESVFQGSKWSRSSNRIFACVWRITVHGETLCG